MHRRSFLAAASGLVLSPAIAGTKQEKRRVAVIGHTGRGNYGHGLDKVWFEIPETQVVAVADANPSGLKSELGKLKKFGVTKGYADYREMLTKEKPEFVSVAPRHADQHHDMVLAAINAGVKGIYVEKPFCRTPAEADAIIAACEKHNVKISVAHRNRYHRALKHIDKLIADGGLGKLLQLKGRGLGDHRGGGEDLWVLGSHILNLIHYFGGKPKSCSAVMLQDDRHVMASDVKPGREGLGPLAGNAVHARYETANGVIAYYDSIANDGTSKKGYCLQIIGSASAVFIHIDRDPVAHFVEGNPFEPTSKSREWVPITTAGVGKPENKPETVKQVQNHVVAVRDLIDACDNNRAPLCDVYEGAATVEMICGVFESHRQGGKTIEFPLKERGNALSKL